LRCCCSGERDIFGGGLDVGRELFGIYDYGIVQMEQLLRRQLR
jgi:hypothetical protein